MGKTKVCIKCKNRLFLDEFTNDKKICDICYKSILRTELWLLKKPKSRIIVFD
jgi:hypothetical protein